jgi:hypothetical protein
MACMIWGRIGVVKKVMWSHSHRTEVDQRTWRILKKGSGRNSLSQRFRKKIPKHKFSICGEGGDL